MAITFMTVWQILIHFFSSIFIPLLLLAIYVSRLVVFHSSTDATYDFTGISITEEGAEINMKFL